VNLPVSRAAIGFILLTVVLDVLSFGLLIPVLPNLLVEFTSGDIELASWYQGIFGTVWAAMQFVFSPLLGAVSDRYGRRPVLLISCFGLAADYVLIALAPDLIWLFIGRVLSGITAASFSTAGAYIADVTEPEKRASAYGALGAAFGVGFVIGPALGGFLGEISLRLPFWVAAGLTFANALYGYFILPESLPVEKRSRFDIRKANPIGSIGLLRSNRTLYLLAVVYFLYHLGHQVLQSTFVLYTRHRYDWKKESTVGLTLMFVGIFSVLVQGGLVRPTVKRLGERKTLLIGMVCGAVGYLGFGLANTQYGLWGMLPVFALFGFFGPSIQALMTQNVASDQQGQLQGANSVLVGIAGMAGPTLFSGIFALAVKYEDWGMPIGTPFFLASFLTVVGFFIAERATRGYRHNPTATDAPDDLASAEMLLDDAPIEAPSMVSHSSGQSPRDS
jgi:DHA1 family tetracycline resistance protein-like MFS transporter